MAFSQNRSLHFKTGLTLEKKENPQPNRNVLITHQPPFSILDYSGNINHGDSNLLEIVLKTKPKYHLFGHIHGAYGIEKSEHTTFVNAAILSENYELMYEPILLKV